MHKHSISAINTFVIEPIENITISSNEIAGEGYIFTIKNGSFNESVTFGLDIEEIKNFIHYLNILMQKITPSNSLEILTLTIDERRAIEYAKKWALTLRDGGVIAKTLQSLLERTKDK